MKRTLLAVCIACVSTAAVARAEESPAAPNSETRTFELQPSRHELSAEIGYQAGFGGQLGSPSGLKITGDYAYKFHPIAWFDLQLGNTFGFGAKDGRCVNSFDSNCY